MSRASPRATLALYQASRALAFLRGLEQVTPDLVQAVAPDVLRELDAIFPPPRRARPLEML